jgi:hypothetical protein
MTADSPPAHPTLVSVTVKGPPFDVTAHRAPPESGRVNLDGFTVVHFANRLRIAVCDPAYNRADSSAWEPVAAAGVVLAAMELNVSPLNALRQASIGLDLVFGHLSRSRLDGRPMVSVAVADLYPDGELDAARAGDCEVWAGRPWLPVLAGSCLTEAGDKVYDTEIAPTKRSDRRAHLAAHDQLWTDESLFATAPLGTLPTLHAQTVCGGAADAVVVCTDGWELTASPGVGSAGEGLDDLAGRAAEMARRIRHPYPHGDLCAVMAERSWSRTAP